MTLGSLAVTLRRIEEKIENIGSKRTLFTASETPSALEIGQVDCEYSPKAPLPRIVSAGSISNESPRHRAISFSAHLTLSWPGVQLLLPESAKALYQESGPDYATPLEFGRDPILVPSLKNDHPGWLSDLSINTLKTLARAYFSTFNTATPILDKDVFFQHTLTAAINGDFDTDIESCIVLTVLALGSWVRITDSGEDSISSRGFGEDTTSRTASESWPGLLYINEARRRAGFLDCNVELQSCQFYLLMGYVRFYQITRFG